MQMDFGTIIAVAAALIFYLRLIILQRHKAKQARSNLQSPSSKSERNHMGQRGSIPQAGLQIVSWYLIGMGVALILLGAMMTAFPIFGQPGRDLWWLVLTVGILLLGLSIR
jgi:hypothetical protein